MLLFLLSLLPRSLASLFGCLLNIEPFLMATSSAALQSADLIYLRDLYVSAIVGEDAWHRPNRQQPVVTTLSLHADVMLAGKLDDVSKTINYGNLCKAVMAKLQDTDAFESLEDLSDVIATTAFQASDIASMIECTIILPKGSLLAEGVGISSSYRRDVEKQQSHRMQMSFMVKKLRVACIIGVNAHERIEKQMVVIDTRFQKYPFRRRLSYVSVIAGIVNVSRK